MPSSVDLLVITGRCGSPAGSGSRYRNRCQFETLDFKVMPTGGVFEVSLVTDRRRSGQRKEMRLPLPGDSLDLKVMPTGGLFEVSLVNDRRRSGQRKELRLPLPGDFTMIISVRGGAAESGSERGSGALNDERFSGGKSSRGSGFGPFGSSGRTLVADRDGSDNKLPSEPVELVVLSV